MVGSFKHSKKLSRRLNQKQIQLNYPEIEMDQDVPTRWNSTHEQ